jgi:uncharacterized protein (DUF952 family)
MSVILHLTSVSAWEFAQRIGEYRAPSLESEGFIHCSLVEQIADVANAWFAGQSGLVLLVLDLTRLRPEVRFEAGADRPDRLFPHVYGPINLDAVIRVLDYQPGQDGRFSTPEMG